MPGKTRIKDCRVVAALIEQFYALPGNGAGGNLHIVLDDDNYEDDSVLFCYEHALRDEDWPAAALAHILLMCSTTQRRKANSSRRARN